VNKDKQRQSDDGSSSMGVAEFFTQTGRFEARSWEDRFTLSLCDPETGLVSAHISQKRNCPICGAPDSRHVFTKQGFPHLICAKCDTVYVSPSIKKADFHRLWYGDESPYPFLDSVNSDAQRKFDRVRFTKILDAFACFTQPGQLLDVGCGGGYFLELAQEYGWKGQGIDVYPRAVDFARERGLYVQCGDACEIDTGISQWDAVTLWEVIDLVPEPLELLESSLGRLKKGGYLGLSFRNAFSLAAMILHEKCNVFLGSNHFQLMSFSTMENLLAAKGLELTWWTGYISEAGVIKNHLSYAHPYEGEALNLPYLSIFTDDFIHNNKLSYKFAMIFKKTI
jgi:2-polyprenyl-3-methyl-5-hydroxy-6-metoxy-1,4-benzoquinol methylase